MRGRKKKSTEMPLLDHFKELRKVLIFSACAIGIGSLGGWLLSDYSYRYLAQPMMQINNVGFITTTPLEPVLVKLKISVLTGFIIALPIIFWQIWSFILPALKKKEKKYLYVIVPSSIILFCCGAAFAFYVVLPIGLKFLMLAGGKAVESIPYVTKSSYLNFIIIFIISFGVVFQLPVVLLFLIRLGIISPGILAKNRKWAFFIIIILAVVISPTPDLFTQFLIAGPMYMLYEFSIWVGYLLFKKRKKDSLRVNAEGESE